MQHIAARGSRTPGSTLKLHQWNIELGKDAVVVPEDSHLTGAVRPTEVHEQRARRQRPGYFRRQQAQLRDTAEQEARTRFWKVGSAREAANMRSDRHPAPPFLQGLLLSHLQSVPCYQRSSPRIRAVERQQSPSCGLHFNSFRLHAGCMHKS